MPASAPTPTATGELASLGVAIALGQLSEDVVAILTRIQNDLFDLGADLCTPIVADLGYEPLRIKPEYTAQLEGWCDKYNEKLSKLDSFILPGGTAGAALLHQSRTLARRAERTAWALYEDDPERTNREVLTYLNRLSDLLFILARVANPDGDVKWIPGKRCASSGRRACSGVRRLPASRSDQLGGSASCRSRLEPAPRRPGVGAWPHSQHETGRPVCALGDD